MTWTITIGAAEVSAPSPYSHPCRAKRKISEFYPGYHPDLWQRFRLSRIPGDPSFRAGFAGMGPHNL